MATAVVKMETLDSGIGSRSPTPDSNLSHANSSKATKVATHSNHINNNSHNNTSSSDGAQNNKTKVSDKGDVSATKPATTSASAATATGSSGGGNNSTSHSSTNGSSNSHNNQGNNASSNNSKTYRDYRHSSGHGQYKKYGNHQNHHYGYGSNVHYHRYNGNRHYGNKYYNSTTNYHHHNNNYQGQGYQHHQYTQQNHHHYNHHGHVHNNNNASNSNGNSSGNNSTNGNSHANSHHHNSQMNHQTQYFNLPSGPPPVVHHQNHLRNATPQVFISSDQVDALSWTRRGGESATNANWSSPGAETNDAAQPPAVPISLNLSVLNNKGFYSPSPQNISPATSPSTTDSSDAYSVQEENGSGTVTVTAAGMSASIIHHSNCVDDVHYTSNNGSLVDTTLNGTVLANHNGTGGGGGGYAYQPFPYHPSAGVYAYPGPNNHIITGGGRTFAHPNHHQLINHQGLLMPADSFTMGKADSSISSGSADKTLEWSEDGMLFNTLIGTDREEFPSSSSSERGATPGAPDIIYAPQLFYTNTAAHYQPANKKRFYSGASSMSGKLSPVPQNHRFHYPNRKMSFYGFPREFYEDLEPEEYVRAFSKFGEVKEMPAALAQNPQCDSLSEEIWLKFHANQQTTETFRKKMELWRDVYRILRNLNNNSNFKLDPRNFPTFGLQVVGSTMSGFGSNTSDVDMCLLVRGAEVDQRYEAVDKLQVLYGALSGTQGLDNVELIYAKVPILKFRDPKRYLEVDLNCNNYVGIRNTHLLYCYSQADWRLKPLVLVVKLWAHHHGINDAKNMTISSYSLVLMVIHFLQSGVEEPVLPNLQKMYPDKFSSSSNILNVKINEVLPAWQSKNKENLGNLLIQFLEYYTNKFDYNEHAVSVRSGGTIPIKLAAGWKAPKNDPHQWKYLCIEEPFDRTNTARSVYDRDTFDKILGIFNLSYQRLLASRNLESIFTHISEADARTMSVLIR